MDTVGRNSRNTKRLLTERMAHRNRPAVNIHLGLIEAEELAICDGYDGERLVDLI